MKTTINHTSPEGVTSKLDVYYIIDFDAIDHDTGSALEILKVTEHNYPNNLVVLPADDTDSLIELCWRHYNNGR